MQETFQHRFLEIIIVSVEVINHDVGSLFHSMFIQDSCRFAALFKNLSTVRAEDMIQTSGQHCHNSLKQEGLTGF